MDEVIEAELWTFKPGSIQWLDENAPGWRDAELFTAHHSMRVISKREVHDSLNPAALMASLLSAVTHDLAQHVVKHSEPFIQRRQL